MLISLKLRNHVNEEVRNMRSTVSTIDKGVEVILGTIRSLGVTSQNILYVEDALGWVIPIPLDIMRSWDVSQSSLCIGLFL